MKFTNIFASLLLALYVSAFPSVQNTEEQNVITQESATGNFQEIKDNIPKGFEKDGPIYQMGYEKECLLYLNGIKCVSGTGPILYDETNRKNICKNNECQKCVVSNKFCMKCGIYLRNTYNFNNCYDIKVDLDWIK